MFEISGTCGQQQHQIIFGKSKDSILVPNVVCSTVAISSSGASNGLPEHNNSKEAGGNNGTQQLQLAQQERKLQLEDGMNDEGQEEAEEILEYSPVTTRVLTDEKGHSIKIRIASPPPQRQSQLVKLHKRQQDQMQEQQQQQQHRDSVASDSPLISIGSISPASLAFDGAERGVSGTVEAERGSGQQQGVAAAGRGAGRRPSSIGTRRRHSELAAVMRCATTSTTTSHREHEKCGGSESGGHQAGGA